MESSRKVELLHWRGLKLQADQFCVYFDKYNTPDMDHRGVKNQDQTLQHVAKDSPAFK